MSESTTAAQPSSNFHQKQDKLDQELAGMKDNLENICPSRRTLAELNDRTDALQQGAWLFDRADNKARKRNKKKKKEKKNEKGNKKKGIFRRRKGRPKIMKKSYWRKKLGLY